MVDLSNMVGTMVVGVTDSRKSYIAGASDRQNDEFQKNIGKGSVKDVIPEGSLVITEDMYESMGIRKEVIGSAAPGLLLFLPVRKIYRPGEVFRP